jgi:hypothetical protein
MAHALQARFTDVAQTKRPDPFNGGNKEGANVSGGERLERTDVAGVALDG